MLFEYYLVNLTKLGYMKENEHLHCQICGEELGDQLVWCARCKTPHHADCWRYTGVCSTYGCGSKTKVETFEQAEAFDVSTLPAVTPVPEFTDDSERTAYTIAQVLFFLFTPSDWYEKLIRLPTRSKNLDTFFDRMIFSVLGTMALPLLMVTLGATLGILSFLYLMTGLLMRRFSGEYIAVVKDRRKRRLKAHKGLLGKKK